MDEGSNPTAVREEFRRMVRETVDTRQHPESSKPGVPAVPLSSSRAPGSSAAATKPSPLSVSAAVLQSSPGTSSEGRGGGGRGEEEGRRGGGGGRGEEERRGGGGGERGRQGEGGGGAVGAGGGDALLTTMSNSAFMGTLSGVMNTGVGHMTSHDENDDVFSPCSTDDEHMKHIEKVRLCLGTMGGSCTHVHDMQVHVVVCRMVRVHVLSSVYQGPKGVLVSI